MQRSTAFLAGCVAALLVSDAFACGESLIRVGRGITFREYSAPLPGNLLVVARTEGEIAMAERLAAAGHDVHVVSDPAQIASEISGAEHAFDIVLAMFSQREAVEAQAGMVTFLPVAAEGAEEAQAADLYGHYVADQASVKQVLREIHSVLRGRS
jgi:hypothetical protein